MPLIHYIEITNFKSFEERIRLDCGDPTVLIGPNNSGKTSVLQALALWSRGVKSWFYGNGIPSKPTLEGHSATINRMDIIEVPVLQTRYLWPSTKTKGNTGRIKMQITVGIELGGQIQDCRLVFTQRDNEVIYCQPDSSVPNYLDVIAAAKDIRVNLLYSMSGIATEEPLLQEGRINVLMGQGLTAQVLRNLCFLVLQNNPSDWDKITRLMDNQFMVKIGEPIFDAGRGTVTLSYQRSRHDERELDITSAGWGMQQVLLILAYLYGHKQSILMIDEPDAHLEILRQKQIYHILNEVATNTDSQLILATHSEVILDEAVDTNLNLILNGKAVNLASAKEIKESLKTFGVEHYYKAKVTERVLYLEGSIDYTILRAFAERINHPACDVLNDRLYCYFIKNINPTPTLDGLLQQDSGYYQDFRGHFKAMKLAVPTLRGFALLDSDAKSRGITAPTGLDVFYWDLYELENYFITPEVLSAHISAQYPEYADTGNKVIRELFVQELFMGGYDQYDEIISRAGNPIWFTMLRTTKCSRLAEQVFERFAEETGTPVLLRKGQYARLIDHLPDHLIRPAIREVLDRIVAVFAMSSSS